MNKNRLAYIVMIIALICAILAYFKACEYLHKEDNKTNVDSLISEIDRQHEIALAWEKLSVKHDSVRTIYKYRYLRDRNKVYPAIDSLPCDTIKIVTKEIIHDCDSVIYSDSLLIADLRHIHHADSFQIECYKRKVTKDSTDILALKKEVKKQKRQKLLFAGATILVSGLAILK